MRRIGAYLSLAFLAMSSPAWAQGPGPRGQRGGSADDFVARLMAFDTNGDGVVSKKEVTDERLASLVDRMDANKDDTISKDEMTAFFAKESETMQRAAGPGGFGPPDGPGAFGPPRPGQVLPGMMQDMLRLNDEQKAELAKLQEDVDKRLANILTPEQREQLRDMGNRGPGGPGGPPGGGRGGSGRPSGPQRN